MNEQRSQSALSQSALSQSALALCRKACRELGWTPAEFWQSTPAEISTIFLDENHIGENICREELLEMMENDRNG